MKAKEAPEKIYIFDHPILDFKKLNIRQRESDIEYTRTDAFIEKAVKWLENTDFCHYYNKDFIEDFRKAMEG